ncbi:Arylacetonitrilase [Exophiala dermatitidis]
MGSSASPATLRVAAAQYEPEWLDLQASVAKTCAIIKEAGKQGVKALGFSEAFIPGYPAWIWQRPLDPVLSTKYIQNSLAVDSDEMRTIQQCAAENGVVVSLGFSENDHNSVYIAQALIDSDGKLLMKRRKLKPTHMERTIFGDASGDSLTNVAQTKIGKRVGALACWEHCQPLLKYHTATQREEIHCAGWPPLSPHSGPELWSMSAEGCLSLAQTYAIETQTSVLHATTVISSNGVDAMSTAQSMLMNKPGGGYSAVIGPDGRRLTEPLDPSTEGLVIADIDPNMAIMARSFLDICGHYSRPDLLWLGCDTRERRHKIDKAGAAQAAAQDGTEEENE